MSNKGALIRFITSALCIALFLTYTSIKGLSYSSESDFIIPTLSPLNFDNSTTSIDSKNPTEQNNEAQENASVDVESPESLAVSATGTAMGKVIEKFISPYTANTSYNNVYLKNNTELQIDLKEFVESDLKINIQKNSEPQVLIMHTHATESYLRHKESYYTENDTGRTTDNHFNVVALGKIITDRLNEAGINTLHDTTQHDYPSYNESYSRSAKTVRDYLNKYPSIKIVIDLHRDALAENDSDKVKLTTEIEGKKAAQIMLVMGAQCSKVKNFPNWRENLKLATKLQQTIESMYPSLARSIHFVAKNYNQSLSNGSMLIEIGTDGNTLDEAKYSAELLSNSLISLLNAG